AFKPRSRACWRMPALSTSLMTMATSAGTSPREIASAIATKLEPLPEPRTPMRNGVVRNTRFLYGKEKRPAIEKRRKRSLKPRMEHGDHQVRRPNARNPKE